MNRLKTKLRARRGETIVEALSAFLIVVLSGVFLAGLIMAASKMNQTATTRRDALTTALNAAETGENPTDGTVTITWDDDGDISTDPLSAAEAVTFTGAESDAPYTSYRTAESVGGV